MMICLAVFGSLVMGGRAILEEERRGPTFQLSYKSVEPEARLLKDAVGENLVMLSAGQEQGVGVQREAVGEISVVLLHGDQEQSVQVQSLAFDEYLVVLLDRGLEICGHAAAALALGMALNICSCICFKSLKESKRALMLQNEMEEEREKGKDVKKEKERAELKQESKKKEENQKETVNVLVQKLDGRHLNVRVTQGVQVSVLCDELCARFGISQNVFYLTRQGRVLHAYEELWLEQDERLCMRGRLRGGMEGDWTCQHCGRQGCWVTKVRCYRCGKSKYDPPNQQSMDGNPNVPGWIRTQARQQTEREWAQATRGAGVGPGTNGQPLGSKPPPPPQQQNQRSQNQRQKTQAQSRAPSPVQEEESYEVLLAALNGLIPSSLLEQVRSSLPKPEKPLTERMMQVQNKLDEEKKAANSWREAVKMREAALVEGRKILADHMTKVEGLQAELSELETQFITQRKEKEEQERKDEREKLAATQVDIEQIPIPEDVDMEDGHNGKKRRGYRLRL